MKTLKKIGFIICIILTAIIYFVLPFIIIKKTTLDYFRNYYSIITSISAIGLGFFYYFHRIKIEKTNKNQDLQRQRLNLLLTELNTFDGFVDKVLNKHFVDDNELSFLRNRISRSFEVIEILLKTFTDPIVFSSEDISVILEVNSFVDKSETIMRTPCSTIKTLPLFELKDIYIEKIKDAKRVCFMCVK